MSGDNPSSKQESTGLLRRMFKRVSNPRDSDEVYSPGDLSSEKKTQLLIHKQRNDLERKREFEELRKLYTQRLVKEEGEEFQLSGGEMSKGSTKQTDTLSKINQLESQMASRWSNKSDARDATNPSKASAGDASISLLQSTPAIKTSDLSELADPFLEEIAVLFASNEDEQVEQSLLELVGPESPQRDDRATWLTLLDFYRAVGKQSAFEGIAMEYMGLFAESAPQWRIFDQAALKKQQLIQSSALGASAYWVAPPIVDEVTAENLYATLVKVAKPTRVMDWSGLQNITPEGAKGVLSVLAKLDQPDIVLQVAALLVVMRVLTSKTKGSEAEENAVFWHLRLELLRLFDSVEEFDMAAMEFCLAHEVSPPSWVPPKCKAENMDALPDEVDDDYTSGVGGSSTFIGDLSSQFYEQGVKAPLRLKGAYKGTMEKDLKGFDAHIVGGGGYLRVNCDRLIRIDFSAAGDLLNWISEKTAKGYSIHFINTHRLAALFFIVMGITVAAQVSLRRD
ncbi:MAG: hypothetical protein ACRCWR_04735 [Saezia sp.]